MRSGLILNSEKWGFVFFSLPVILAGLVRAQDAMPAAETSSVWQHQDWLSLAGGQQQQTASGGTFLATAGQEVKDPFTVLSTDSLWQEKYEAVYTRQLADPLSLSCETSAVMSSDDSMDLSNGQKISCRFQPSPALTLGGDLHDSSYNPLGPGEAAMTGGFGFFAESHLPLNGVVSFDLHLDRSEIEAPSGLSSQTDGYDAQWQQPIGRLPLSAVVSGHIEGTSTGGAPATSLPSLEQSLVWKPLQETTLQMGLRQQQYQEYPGVDHLLNEALFADWSQKIMDDVSWHSYAEVLNSRGLLDDAPAAPLASGANGTAQATAPGSNASLTSSLPVSIDDQTLTFSTGPSFRLQKDLSASVEYSDRWDRNPAAGSAGQEQRVSVSLKGSF